ncbi:DUF2516 family protein [Intrasporangium calvum]|uniref:DUF2516 family protein n=1 Tax=Intrasporangium calvum TaxID=53358 RepID=A0ABT5GGR1_9MICO|nr:DUF2516 family protein [Intrasporangium calvum]MDC5697307.1 DUF2516 family protein [Intrasporangium calvum]
MQLFYGFQNVVLLVIGAVAFGAEIFAFVDALRHPERAYLAAGKRTRTFWLVILGAAVAIGFVTMFNPLNLFGLLAIVGASVYLADVRPALRQVRGIGGSSSRW